MGTENYKNCMKRRFTFSPYWMVFALLLCIGQQEMLQAQTALQQRVTQQCYTGPTRSFGSTTGTLMPSINFSVGNGAGQIPVNHVIADVIVEVVWSKTDDGSCTASSGQPSLLEQVGFQIFKSGTAVRYLAVSNGTSNLTFPPTTNTFAGNFPPNASGIVQNTIYFRDGGLNTFPYAPQSGDTITPNNQRLDFYRGLAPQGNWQIGAVNDAGPAICIHSYCITLITCEASALSASCKAFPEVALDPTTGTHTFQLPDVDSASDISCLVDSIIFSPSSVNCSNMSTPVSVLMTIQDNLNNVDSCRSLVTVRDTTPPVIPFCSQPLGTPFTTLFLDANGRDTLEANIIPMFDNCGAVIQQVRALRPGSAWGSNLAFDCSTGLGLKQLWVRGVDLQGNIDSCRIVIELRDTIPPTAVCGQTTLNVGNGAITLAPLDVDGGSSDVCSFISGRAIDVLGGPNPVYTCADLGVDTVSLIVSDPSGNVDTCTNAVVTVIDNVAPTAICQNATVYLNASGTGMLLPQDVDGGSVDTCGIVTRTVNGGASTNYSCADVGTPQNVVLRVIDASGNDNTCAATVTVLDTFGPTAICQNATAYINPSGVATVAASALNNNSTDVCTGTNLRFGINGSLNTTFDCADAGNNAVTLTVTDANGNSSTCSATITVQDTTPPVANCASPTVYLNNNGLVTVLASQLNAGSTDNCGIVDTSVNVVGIPSINYNCSAIFTPQTPNLVVRDAAGNQGTCQATVNVLDTVLPRAICRSSYTATLNAAGVAFVTPANIDSASNDNCGIVQYLINGVNSQRYDCSDVGTLSAVLTVRDSSNGTSTCRATINVVDNTLPIASCRITTAYLSASGTVAISPNDVLAFPATGDNCPNFTTSFAGGNNNIVYNCDSVGARSVTVVVEDASGNQAVCQTTVNIRDTINPTANCRTVPFTVQLDNNGNGFVTPFDINNGSSDICGLDTLLVNGVDTFFYNCNNVGNTAVTLLVRDASGGQDFCVAPIVVADNINPVARCRDTTLFIGASGVVTAFPADIDGGSTDNCGFTSQINNLPSVTYNCNQVGQNSAQLQITDGGGNVDQCSATITIVDTITPVARCVAPNTVRITLDTTCFASVPASIFNDGSSDNCNSTLAFTVNGLPNASFTAANLTTNPNPITLRVCDGSNRCDVCNTTVIVEDNTPPTVVCRPDTVQLDGNGNAIIVPNNINGGSSDNCSTPVYTINGGPLVNFDCTNLGSNTVTLTGQDQSGNRDSCTTTVFVQDLTAPNASCRGTVTVTLDPGTNVGTLVPTQVDNGSSDNCRIANYTLSRTTFNCNDIPNNPHTISLVVTDQSGNTDTCTTQVRVVDAIDPVAVCRRAPLTLYLVGSSVSTTAAAIDNGSFDNCGLATLTLNRTSFDCNDVGSNPVVLTATDSSGNTNSCNATIIVADTVDPTPFCSNPTIQLDANGNVGVAAQDLAPGSFDNCLIDTFLVNGRDSVFFNCSNLGANTVTVFMRDPSGNDATCPSTITVEDNVAPTATCVAGPINLQLDRNGVARLTPAQVDNNSVDNCNIVTRTLSRTIFRCADVGSVTSVLLTVTDQDGNSSSCSVNVTVSDTTPPNMVCRPGIVYLTSGGTASVSAPLFDGGTNDSCGIASLSFRGIPNVVTCSEVGTRNVTLIATDVNGNVDSCTTTLTVLDTIAPVIICDTITLDLDANGNVSVDSTTAGLYTVTDACGVVSLTLNGGTVVDYTCADIGPNNIQLVATDGSNNSDNCTAVVIVRDVTAPVVSCSNTIQYLNPDGRLPVDPSWITATIVEACGIDTIFTTPDTLDCSNVGTFNPVTLTVVDLNGASGSCNGNIEVRDTTPPMMVCRDTAVCLNGGFVNVTPADVDGGSMDVCGMSPIQSLNGSNNVIFTCADLGRQVVVLQRQDVNGNVDTCQANITVQDCTPPSAICRSTYTAQLRPDGLAVVYAINLDFGSRDDCGIDSSTFRINGRDSLVYNCGTINTPITVQFTVRDFAGNVDTCFTTITVQDTVAPVARCGGPINAVLSATTGAFVVPAFNLNNTNNPSSDNCGISSYLINGQASDTFDCSMLGPNVVILTVTDNNNNSDTCQAIVNVQDITAPTANCVFRITQTLDPNGQATLPAANLVSSSSDNCGIASITGNGLDTLSFDCSNIGTNQIQVVVTDSSGNPFNCSSIVNVVDNTPPVAICPTNPVPVYLAANGTVWARAAQLDSASADNCGIASYQINGRDSVLYNCSQIGLFPSATLTVVDSSGLNNSCSVTIDVLDTIAPVALCNSNVTVTLSPAGLAFVGPGAIDSASFDNCGIASYLINNQSLDTFDCGDVNTSNSVVLTVIDQYNNQSFCTANVTVIDNSPPTVQCPLTPIDFFVGNNGVVVVSPQDIATASDTCSILNWFINGQTTTTFDCSAIGPSLQVLIRVEDPSGNSAQCNAIINIRDNIAPTPNCQNVTVALDSSGTAVVCASDLTFGSTDNCAIVDTLINGQNCMTYTCDSVTAPGAFRTAFIRLVDASGNDSTCVSQIQIVDNIAPVLDCNDTVRVQLNQNGIAIIQPVTLINSVSDACTPLILNISQDTFTCGNVGFNNSVTVSAQDAHGQTSTCPSIIQVEDNIAPTVICQNFDLFLNASGTATLVADSLNNGSFDNCGISSVLFGNNTNTQTFNCTDTGTIAVTIVIRDFSGNLDSCSTTVTVRDTTGPSLSCRGLTVDLTQTGQRTLTPADVLNSSNDNCGIASIFVSPSTITCTDIGNVVYTVTATDNNGNIGTCMDTVRVFLDRPSIIIPANDTVLCVGDTLPLSATVPPNGINYIYQWSGPNGAITMNPTTTDTIVTGVSIADQGSYIFTISPRMGSGCPASDSIRMTINDVPPPVLASIPTCDGDTGAVYLSNISAYNGTIVYNWYFNGNLVSNNSDTLFLPNMTVADSGNYSLSIQVVQSAAACSDSSVVGIDYDVLDLPAAPVPTANLPCEGQTLTLLNNAPGNTYVWSGPAGFSSTQANPTRANAAINFGGLYSLTITDANGCSSDSSINVVISPTPRTPSVFYTEPLCVGDLLELQDTSVYAFPPVLYFWERPSGALDTTTIGQLFIANADPGEYQLTVSMNGCPSAESDTAVVAYEPIPTGSDDRFTISFRDSLIGGDLILNDNPNATGYTLGLVDSTAGGRLDLNNSIGTINYYPRSGFFGVDTFHYSLCDALCSSSCDTLEVLIEVQADFECYIPQGISPNGDGINDQLFIRCKNNYPNAVLQVFSRWGVIVYEGEPTGWNGQFNGDDLPDGTYFYILKLNDTSFTGTGTNRAEGRVGDQYTGYIMLQR